MNICYRKFYFIFVVLILFIVGIFTHSNDVNAISLYNGWAPSKNISNSTGQAFNPILTADGSGIVHIFWSQTDNPGNGQNPDTIYYTTWDGSKLGTIVDVFAVPLGGSISAKRTFVDQFGRLWILWETQSSINLSYVVATGNISARNWKTRLISENTGATSAATFVVDRSGIVHILSTDGRNIYYRTYNPDTNNESPDKLIAFSSDEGSVFSALEIVVDESFNIFVVADVRTAETNWTPSGVVFIRSLDNGQNWFEPQNFNFQKGNGQPAISIGKNSSIMIFWNRSVGSTDGRYYTHSEDKGATFAHPTVAFTNNSGFAGPPNLLWDSNGLLHLIDAGYGPGGTNVWHSTWTGEIWSEPKPIASDPEDSEGASATILMGNQIFAVWNELTKHQIWMSFLNLNSPEIKNTPYPTFIPQISSTPVLSKSIVITQEPTFFVQTKNLDQKNKPIDSFQSTPGLPMIIGTASSFLLVIIFLLLKINGSKKK